MDPDNQAVSNGGSTKGKSGDDRTPRHAADVPQWTR
jgi:hypothetical protein